MGFPLREVTPALPSISDPGLSRAGDPRLGRAPAGVKPGYPERMAEATRARALGINHVALEVGDVDEALAFYGQVFELSLRGRIGSSMAFVDLGDQFVAIARGDGEPAGTQRHFGLVVDDKDAVRARMQ